MIRLPWHVAEMLAIGGYLAGLLSWMIAFIISLDENTQTTRSAWAWAWVVIGLRILLELTLTIIALPVAFIGLLLVITLINQ